MKLCPACQRCYEDTDAVCSFDATALVPSRHGSRMITDKYRLDRLLGRGGMGAVYEGTHVELERPVAIKLLLPDFTADQEALERFRREARAAARLNHPHVADTYDYGALAEGGAYIVMELIAGQTLRERMDEAGQLPFGEAVEIARQVTSGVEAAHRHGITHRDLKPSNIILTHDHDNHMLAKVVDFSVAKLKEGTTSGAALTATGSLIGTPRYMAPEQCADNRADARSDIYSLGVILYEMLAGRAPFEGPTTTAIAIKHIQEPPPPVEKFRPDTPAGLRKLIAEALAKSPSDRPQTAQEFGARLEEAAKELPPSERGAQSFGKPAEASVTERGVTQTNPQRFPTDSDTARAGEPTREDALPQKAADPPSVQSYAVTTTEAEEEIETKVSARAAEQFETVKETKPDATVRSQDETGRMTATEGSFPLLSEHSKTAPEADSTETVTRTAPLAQSRTNYLPYVVAAALLFIVGLGTYMLAFRGRSAQRVDDSQTASTGNRSAAATNSNGGPVKEDNRPALSDASASPSPAPSATPAATSPRDARAELLSLRDDWVNATVAHDINRLMAFYPPVMDSFYLKHNVPRAAVRAEKQAMIAQASSIDLQTSAPEISLSEDGRTATMTFRKSWNFRGALNSSGEVIQELRWIKTDDGWKITSERDISVIR